MIMSHKLAVRYTVERVASELQWINKSTGNLYWQQYQNITNIRFSYSLKYNKYNFTVWTVCTSQDLPLIFPPQICVHIER